MAYVINKTNGAQLVVLEDGTVNTSTSLGLVGRNYTGYGEIQNENFVQLLENFANINPPARPLEGQAWYNTTLNVLNVYTGNEWIPVGSATLSNSPPPGSNGTFWFKQSTNQLFVYSNNEWSLIGPEGAEGYDVTKIRTRQVLDSLNQQKIILDVVVDGVTVGIISNSAFTLNDNNPITGFSSLAAGFTMSSNKIFKGSLDGNAFSATRLQTARYINGVIFDGQSDITIEAKTPGVLSKGSYIVGSNFNGQTNTTWSVDASPNSIIGKVVARDSAGDFSANVITADLVGNVTGNVTTNSGVSVFNRVEANEFVGAQLSGNSLTATRLKEAVTINGVPFDGSQNIVVSAAGDSLIGTSLAPNIVNLGTLNDLSISDSGLTIGSQLRFYVESGSIPTIKSSLPNRYIKLEVYDAGQSANNTHISLLPSDVAVSLGGNSNPALIPEENNVTDLGITTKKWKTVYASTFDGTATAARYADLAENYLADAQYIPGTVVEFGGNKEITIASDETRRVAGVVSSSPAYLMNSGLKGDYVVAVALQGRVPCKVRGKIHKGDMLVSGGNGYARPTQDPKIGTIIGKALEDFDGVEGIIEVVVGRI